MFSTIKDICKVTFSITKNTAKLSGEALKLTNEFVKSEEFKDGLQFVNEGLKSMNEGLESLNKSSHVRLLKTRLNIKVKKLCLVEEEVFDDVELKTKIIKFINNDVEKINNKFNVNISFIEHLSLDDFIKTIDSIIVDDLSMNEIDDLFDALNSIELTSKINKDKIEELFESLYKESEFLKAGVNMQQKNNNPIVDKLIKSKLIEIEPVKNELIELLSKDEVFNKILSQ